MTSFPKHYKLIHNYKLQVCLPDQQTEKIKLINKFLVHEMGILMTKFLFIHNPYRLAWNWKPNKNLQI